MCNVSAHQSTTHKLRSDSPQVTVLVNRTALDQPADAAVREGQGLLLRCDVRAKPADSVHLAWYRDGAPIKHANTRMLAIQLLDRSFHASRFTCEAKNVVGQGSANLDLDVHCEFRASTVP